MTFNVLIEELRERQITITFSGGKLKFSGPEENVTPEIIEELKRNKGKLIKYFWPKEFGNLMPINPEGSKVPLFLVHGDNGNYIVSEHLGADQPVFGFFHPGSDGEGIPFRNVETMAKSYLERVLSVNPAGPFYLVGFSFGGSLAFEMACQLQRMGHKVPFLVIIDSISPLALKPFRWSENIPRIPGILKKKIIRSFKLSVCRLFILVRKPTPKVWRKFYIWEKYDELFRKFKPGKFDGDLLLFRAAENLSSHKYLGWEPIVNNIDMVTLDAAHLSIFKNKESVDKFRAEIKLHLDNVNSAILTDQI